MSYTKILNMSRAFFIGSLFILSLSATAEAFDVNRATDEGDANLGDTLCDTDLNTVGEQCTLRAAIQEADQNGGNVTINIPADTTIFLTESLNIGNPTGTTVTDVTLQGADPRTSIVDGGGLGRVFDIQASAQQISLSRITVRKGNVIGDGGGILNNGSLTIDTVIIESNQASGLGGGIQNLGTLEIRNSTIGGIARYNSASEGGGINNQGTLTLVNSTISGNRTTTKEGGGLHNLGTTDFYNVTLFNNSVPDTARGGGVWSDGQNSVFHFQNSIIAGNKLGLNPSDCSGTLTSLGHNILGVNDCSVTPGDGDQFGAIGSPLDPKLTGLQDNGGPTRTHAPLSGSPTVDKGYSQGCADPKGGVLSSDQRGFSRPVGITCDIGSIELESGGGGGTTNNGPPSASLSTTFVDFNAVLLRNTAGPRDVILTNTGGNPLDITSITVSGNGNFIQSNDCGSQLAAGASCKISVTFTPTIAGLQEEKITLVDTAYNSPQTINLSGTGQEQAAPIAGLHPKTLNLGNWFVNETSYSSQTVNLRNEGLASLNIINVTISGDFIIGPTNTCENQQLAVGAECKIEVKFSPTQAGLRTGEITITDDAGDSPQKVALSGNGVVRTPSVELFPSSTSTMPIDFGGVVVNQTSPPIPLDGVILINNGTAALHISNIKTYGDFAIASQTCGPLPAEVQVSQYCKIYIAFTPTTTGIRTGMVTITDDAVDSPQTIFVTGTGQSEPKPLVSLSLNSVDLGGAVVGQTSAAQSVLLRNEGSAALNISNISASGDFYQTNDCGTQVDVGRFCTFFITFTPTATGARNGTLTITDNALDSPQTITLTGVGQTAPAPIVSLSATTVDFGGTLKGDSSRQEIFLRNAGSASLNVTSITSDNTDFQASGCQGSVSVGSSCGIGITFAPSTTGVRNGILTIRDTAADSPQTIALSGEGLLTPAPDVSLDRSSVNFGGVVVGQSSSPESIVVKNSGSAALNIQAVQVSGDFSEGDNCSGRSIDPNKSCTIIATFQPSATGTRQGSVTLTNDAGGSPHTITLSGTGLTAPSPLVTLSTTFLDFGGVVLNQTSSSQPITLTNDGVAPLTVTGIAVSGDFSETDSCLNGAIDVGLQCTITVSFAPTLAGTRSGSITIASTAANAPQVISLSGIGQDSPTPLMTLSTTSIKFDPAEIGQTSPSQPVTVTNNGSAPLTISGISLDGDFSKTDNCQNGSIDIGLQCILTVTFTPTAVGTRNGTATLTSDASNNPQIVDLTGTGLAAQQGGGGTGGGSGGTSGTGGGNNSEGGASGATASNSTESETTSGSTTGEGESNGTSNEASSATGSQSGSENGSSSSSGDEAATTPKGGCSFLLKSS